MWIGFLVACEYCIVHLWNAVHSIFRCHPGNRVKGDADDQAADDLESRGLSSAKTRSTGAWEESQPHIVDTSSTKHNVCEEQQSHQAPNERQPSTSDRGAFNRKSDRQLDQPHHEVPGSRTLLDLPPLPQPEDESETRKHVLDEDENSEDGGRKDGSNGKCDEELNLPSTNDVPSRPKRDDSFGNDIARRTFLEKDDEYSDNELIAACRGLNGRINHLSGHLIRAKNRMRGRHNVTSGESTAEALNPECQGDGIAKFVQAILGDRLSEELASAKGGTGGPTAINHIIRDGLDAWSISCVYLAMKPLLFGLRVRTDEEINEIIEHMNVHEPEMAECWNRFREKNTRKPNDDDETMSMFLSDVWSLQNGRWDAEIRESEILETVYRAIRSDGDNELQVCLHWRALVHKHELRLESYKAAIAQTKEIIKRGLLRVFVMAGEEPPSFSDNPNLVELVDKIVEEAAILAKWIKTTIFSQNIEVFVAEREKPYDKQSMISDQNGGV